jgi:hypothetical protein
MKFNLFRVYAGLLLLLLINNMATASSSSTRPYSSKVYRVRPFPTEWRPLQSPPTETRLSALQSFRVPRQMSVRAFVARFGIPHRYLVTDVTFPNTDPSRILNGLIYDLSHGYHAELWVQKPPSDVIVFAFITAPDGHLVPGLKTP